MAAAPQFDLHAYLERIGLAEARPDAESLRAIQQAHLRNIPFENFDPLLGRIPLLQIGEIADKVVDGGRGGYCFELNGLFGAALAAAGFSLKRRLARVRMRFGVDGGRSHLVLLVEADGRRFLADAGFGGPGPLVPVDLGIEEEQQAPNGTYRVTHDGENGETVLERREADGWLELYAFDEARVTDAEIVAANHVCATWDGAPFGSHLLFGFYRGETRYGLFDRALTIETPGGEEKRDLADFAEFAELVAGQAGLSLPEEALAEAWAKIGLAA